MPYRNLTCFSGLEILAPGLVAQAVLALSIVAAAGLALGSIGFRGIRLGAAGVLFVGIFFGQLGMHLDQAPTRVCNSFQSDALRIHDRAPTFRRFFFHRLWGQDVG